MKISEIENKNVKIGATSLSVKDDKGKFLGDVAKVIHSEWHVSTVRMNCIDVTCRNCHRTEKISVTNYFEYCPHCGAKMDGERNIKNENT